MATISNITVKCLGNSNQTLIKPTTSLIVTCRNASKKTGTTTQNAGNSRPKHRGWQRQDGHIVTPGTILVKQNTTRFHPGLNVGLGRNGNLFAIHPGKVVVTCEKINPDWEHNWIKKFYEGKEGNTIYKKHFNVIPEPEHRRFKLIDKI